MPCPRIGYHDNAMDMVWHHSHLIRHHIVIMGRDFHPYEVLAILPAGNGLSGFQMVIVSVGSGDCLAGIEHFLYRSQMLLQLTGRLVSIK